MIARPPLWLVLTLLLLAGGSMSAAVYFGGTGRMPLAMTGAALFVILGGVAFELARRRSV